MDFLPMDHNYPYGGPNIQPYHARYMYGPGSQAVYDPEVMPYHGRSTTAYLESPECRLDLPTFISIHEKYLKPQTLDSYGLSWEYDKDLLQCKPDHIMIKQYIDRNLQAMLFAHTRGLKMGLKLGEYTKSRSRSKTYSTNPVGAQGYIASRVSSQSSKRSIHASPNKGFSRSARRDRRSHHSSVGNYVPDYRSPCNESFEDVASNVRRGRSPGRASSAASTEETFSHVCMHSPTRSIRSQRAVNDRPLGEAEASIGHKDKYFRLRDKVESLKKELSRIRNSRLSFTSERLKQDIAKVRAARNKAERRMAADRERCLSQRLGDNGEYMHEPFGTSSDASVQDASAAESGSAAPARTTHRDERQRDDIVITVVDGGQVLGLGVKNNLGRELSTLVRYQDKYGATWQEKLKALSPQGETRCRRQRNVAQRNGPETHSGMDNLPPGWRSPSRGNQLRDRYAELKNRHGRTPLDPQGSGLSNATKPRRWEHVMQTNSVTDAVTTKSDWRDKGKGKAKLVHEDGRLGLPVAPPEVQSVTQDDIEAVKGEGENKGKCKGKANATPTHSATKNVGSSMNSDETPVLTPAASVDDVERVDADVARKVEDEFDFGERTPLGEVCEW